MVCPACGAENRAGAKFCNECGAPLIEAAVPRIAVPPPDPAFVPVDVSSLPLPSLESMPPRDPSELPATHPEWRMSSAGPLPEQPKRRLWLWIGGGLLACVVMFLIMNVLLAGVVSNAPAP